MTSTASKSKASGDAEAGKDDVDPVTGAATRPAGPGLYLHWDGRKSYRTRMPAPRVLEPEQGLSLEPESGNRIIEGDNLQSMVSLRSQYNGSVDIAYLDPPYNTGRRDFRYSDGRFRDPNASSDDAIYVSNEDGGRHTKWLNYMGPRLWLTWELLADHGVLFISINDVELFRLGLLLDEIFDERNRLGVLVWKGAIENNPTHVAQEHEYVLCYAKRKEAVTRVWSGYSEGKQWLLNTYEELAVQQWTSLAALERAYQKAIREHAAARKKEIADRGETELVDLGRAARYKHVDERGVYAAEDHTDKPSGGYFYDVIHPETGLACKKPASGYRFTEDTMNRLISEGRIVFGKDHVRQVQVKKYLKDVAEPLRSVISIPGKLGTATLKKLLGEEADRFPHPKPVELIERLIASTGYDDALVLDPFAGSGTTGHAVLRQNARDGGTRRFILIEEGLAEDRYCRTLTAPRVRAAIEVEGYESGFTFESTGRKLDRDAILGLERATITNLVMQTDATGVGGGLQRLTGQYVIAANGRREAIALYWNGRNDSAVSRDILVAMFEEATAMGLRRPLRVYGSTCELAETESFRFCQIPDAILAALHLVEEAEDGDAEELAEAFASLTREVDAVAGSGAGR
jgi:adenine-specific DNA-methyltransferase